MITMLTACVVNAANNSQLAIAFDSDEAIPMNSKRVTITSEPTSFGHRCKMRLIVDRGMEHGKTKVGKNFIKTISGKYGTRMATRQALGTKFNENTILEVRNLQSSIDGHGCVVATFDLVTADNNIVPMPMPATTSKKTDAVSLADLINNETSIDALRDLVSLAKARMNALVNAA